MLNYVKGVQKDIDQFKKYIKDGFDFSDLIRLTRDLFKQVKDEFLEFNGIGSLLAGGVLVTSLYKIFNIVKEVAKSFKSITSKNLSLNVKNTPLENKDMLIHANTVIVKGIATKGQNAINNTQAIKTNTITTTAGTAKKGKFSKTLKNLKGIYGIGAILGAVDIYSVIKENNERLKEAGENPLQKEQIEKESDRKLMQSIGGALGGGLGVTLGGALGSVFSPIGTMVGAMIGGVIGEEIGNTIGEKAPAIFNTVKKILTTSAGAIAEFFTRAWSAVGEFGEKALSAIGSFASSSIIALQNFTESIGMVFQRLWDGITIGVKNICNKIVDSFFNALQNVKNAYSSIGNLFNTITSPISTTVNNIKNSYFKSEVENVTNNANTKKYYFNREVGALPHYVSGTSNAVGGFTEINEHGGEIIDLPQGSRVYPHATTMKMLGENIKNPHTSNILAPNITITGNEFVVREDADIEKIAYELSKLIVEGTKNYSLA